MGRYDERTALVVVDLQNDFVDQAGSLPVAGAGAVVERVNAEVRAARKFGALVVATQDWHPESTPHFAKDGGIWPVHCVAGTWGAELASGFDVPADMPRIRKGANGEDGYSGFMMRDVVTGEDLPTDLDRQLRDAPVERVIVCGVATDYCVRATALDAVRLGYAVSVLTDAVAAVDLKVGDGARALDELSRSGVTLE